MITYINKIELNEHYFIFVNIFNFNNVFLSQTSKYSPLVSCGPKVFTVGIMDSNSKVRGIVGLESVYLNKACVKLYSSIMRF